MSNGLPANSKLKNILVDLVKFKMWLYILWVLHSFLIYLLKNLKILSLRGFWASDNTSEICTYKIVVFQDPETGLHRGFASVKFENPEAATAAIQSRPHVIDGDLVGIEIFMPLKQTKSGNFKTM